MAEINGPMVPSFRHPSPRRAGRTLATGVIT
jgi:hypothetical protein